MEETNDKKEIKNVYAVLKAPRAVQVILRTEGGKGLYTSVITDFDEENIFITAPTKGKADISLKEGDRVRIVYFADDAMYEFETQVMGFRLDQYGGREYELLVPRRAWRIQRRNFYRLPIHIDAQYREAQEEKTDTGTKVTPAGEYKKCLITDVSGGGMAFQVNEALAIDGFVEVAFSMEQGTEKQDVCEIVKVVRVLPARTGTKSAYQYRCGGYFFAIDERLRSEVIRFTMQKQIEFFGKGR